GNLPGQDRFAAGKPLKQAVVACEEVGPALGLQSETGVTLGHAVQRAGHGGFISAAAIVPGNLRCTLDDSREVLLLGYSLRRLRTACLGHGYRGGKNKRG